MNADEKAAAKIVPPRKRDVPRPELERRAEIKAAHARMARLTDLPKFEPKGRKNG